MNDTLSRSIIETLVRKAITDIQDAPKRSIRNLVDMALTCANGRFQSHFFQAAQTMLKKENSSYYRLVPDTAATVDADRIVTFGLNLGYNSCTVGARTIRSLEKQEHFNIPWSVFLTISGKNYPKREADYRSVLEQGKALGVYTWMIYALDDVRSLLPLAMEHPECAFVLYCSPKEITAAMLKEAEGMNNVMFAVHHSDGVEDACHLLRSGRFLYSMFHTYGKSNLDSILNGEYLKDAKHLHPVFTAFLADPDCPGDVRESVYKYINQVRREQIYPTIPWDVLEDSRFVDSVISGDSCSVEFDPDGYLHTSGNCLQRLNHNIFHQPLTDILRLAFPKDNPPSPETA